MGVPFLNLGYKPTGNNHSGHKTTVRDNYPSHDGLGGQKTCGGSYSYKYH